MQNKKRTTLQAVVGEALDRSGEGNWPVSVADTVNRVHAALPDCDLTDDELSDLVAIAAMERGLSIAFDRDLLNADKSREPLFA